VCNEVNCQTFNANKRNGCSHLLRQPFLFVLLLLHTYLIHALRYD
jgi:hypothetical protein